MRPVRWIRAGVAAAPALLLAAGVATGIGANAIVDLSTGEWHLEVDPSQSRLLPEDDPARLYYQRVRRIFGSDESLVVALAAADVFTRENLERVVRLTRRIEALEGVHHVVSLANALDIRSADGEMEIAPFLARVPESASEIAALERAVMSNPVYAGNLVTRDRTATALLVYFLDFSDREFSRRAIDLQIVRIAEEERGDAQVWVSGLPRIKAFVSRLLVRELAQKIPLIAGVLAAVLVVTLRSLHGVVVPMLSLGFAMVWTLGLAAGLGYALNAISVLVPPLLATLGITYSVHVVTEFDALGAADPRCPRGERAARALAGVAGPVLLTGLTTAVGFLSMWLSPIAAIREFGTLSMIGVAASVLSALGVAPALLRFLGPRHPRAASSRPGSFARFSGAVADFDLRHRRAIFVVSGAIALVAIAGASRVTVGTDQIRKFPADEPVRVDFEKVNEHLEGANLIYVVVEAAAAGAFVEPGNLRRIEALQEWLEAQPEVGGTTSLVDYLKLLNRGFHDNDPAALQLPSSRRLASQLLFFGGNDELERFVDARHQITSIVVRSRVVDSVALRPLSERIQARLAQLPPSLHGTLTGNPVVLDAMIATVMRGQVASLAAALGVIWLLLSLMFTSLRTGALALIPNLLPVGVYFGVLGLAGVPLKPATTLVAPLVIGVAVDDTIHYFARFNREARRLADDRLAVRQALIDVGRPVTFTSLGLVAGFCVLAISELRTQVEVGLLGAFALAFAWLADMLLTPAICAGLRVATLWDVLSLDLGDQPQRAIPLLAGLSSPQARIVALMSEVVRVPAGTRLIHRGEKGEALFVVVDGELRASVPGRHGPIQLAVHGRGDVIGEVGLLRAIRTADVDATRDSRLLRLTPEGLERLRRRSPRIAARVHHNLNRILAERLTRVTDRLTG
ncbi:MAG: MMPL family transporter [Myxococcota bacterium]